MRPPHQRRQAPRSRDCQPAETKDPQYPDQQAWSLGNNVTEVSGGCVSYTRLWMVGGAVCQYVGQDVASPLIRTYFQRFKRHGLSVYTIKSPTVRAKEIKPNIYVSKIFCISTPAQQNPSFNMLTSILNQSFHFKTAVS